MNRSKHACRHGVNRLPCQPMADELLPHPCISVTADIGSLSSSDDVRSMRTNNVMLLCVDAFLFNVCIYIYIMFKGL